MTLILGIAIGIVAKTLIPMPWLDDRIRAGWRRLTSIGK